MLDGKFLTPGLPGKSLRMFILEKIQKDLELCLQMMEGLSMWEKHYSILKPQVLEQRWLKGLPTVMEFKDSHLGTTSEPHCVVP